MRICFFGDYDQNYARSRVLIKGLRENGVVVLECHSDKSGLAKYWDLYKKHQALKGCYDILIVGQSFKSRLVWLARLLSSKKIVWDAFYSFYDKYVYDSQLISPKSLKAKYHWWIEKMACHWADLILLDTNEHIKYFFKEFGETESKFVRVLVGTDIETDKLSPAQKEKGLFLVHFHGKYIPLQGVKYIVEAAKILEPYSDIKFNLVGSGQDYVAARKLSQEFDVKNINFIGRVPFSQLTCLINNADLCLGIFGDTPKAQRVIPNKIFEAIAVKKPVVTADTPAIKELFSDRKNILMCKVADPKDLAGKILEMKDDLNLRQMIARGGYELFKSKATPKIIAGELLQALQILL